MCAIAAALTTVAIGAGLSAYAASEQAGAQEDANEQNSQNMRDTNAANLLMFRENRGSTGSALLPIYAKDGDGNKIEPKLFQDTLADYDLLTRSSPKDNLARYKSILGQYSEAQAGADRTARGIFNGDLEREALAANQPVAEARLEGVAGRKQAGMEALNKTLNEIKAIQAKKGFTGDSLGGNMLRFNARRGINTSAAVDQAQANLDNANDVRQVRTGAIAARLGNLNLPYNMTRQAFTTADAPEDALLDRTARRQQLFNWFRMGQGNFQYQPLPQVQPVAGTGQIVAQGLGTVASGVGNLAMSNYGNSQALKAANLNYTNAAIAGAGPSLGTGVSVPQTSPGLQSYYG